jgi:hypothetical protein
MALLCDISQFTELPVTNINSTLTELKPKVSDKNYYYNKGHLIINNIENTINNWIFRRIESLSQLENNWDGFDAVKPNRNVIRRSQDFTQFCTSRGQKIYNCSPGLDGEIVFELRNQRNEKSIELILYPQKTVMVQFGPGNFACQKNIFENSEFVDAFIWLNSLK